VTGVRGTPMLSTLVPRRPGARWMRVGVYYHAGSIAPLNTPVTLVPVVPRSGSEFSTLFSRLLELLVVFLPDQHVDTRFD